MVANINEFEDYLTKQGMKQELTSNSVPTSGFSVRLLRMSTSCVLLTQKHVENIIMMLGKILHEI